MLKGISAFAGATIMGDGSVALILDVIGIAQRSNVVSDTREDVVVKTSETEHEEEKNTEEMLIFKAGNRDRVALPLPMVTRLEEFLANRIEQ